MTSVESRVVTMKFDNAQFAKAAADTLGVLQKLSGAITGLGAVKGLSSLTTSASKVDMTPIGTQVDGINAKFLALGTVAVTTLANITNRAVDSGLSIAKSLTIEPISKGLDEYETNLNSIQTILANTSAAGTNLKDVNGALDELNEYSDKTIYNFSEMARNIGTFTAAGVDLDTAVGSIKGIANLAALSGSNSQQASTAMYQLSQAISAGRVSLMDWNSVVNAGMGGSVFQRALAETAVAMGTINDGAVQLKGEMKNVTINGQSFRESIMAGPGQQSWLTSDVLTNTLEQFTGDLSRAELAAQGFNDAQIDAIQKQAKMATDAATKVKSLTQLIDVAKETAQSGWAETWRYIFGDFKEARESFTAASEAVNDVISSMSDARNSILKDWKAMGGRTVLIEGIVNIFEAIGNVIKPIKKAFQDVFPPATGEALFRITEAFRDFTEGLIASGPTMRNIRAIFTTIFQVVDILGEVLFGVIKYIASFFGLVFQGTGGMLDLVAAIFEVVSGLIGWVSEGNLVTKFFDGLIEARAKVLGPIIDALAAVLSFLGDIVRSGADAVFGLIAKSVEKATPYLEDAAEYFEKMSSIVRDELASRIENLVPILERVRDYVVQLFESFSLDGIMDSFSFDVDTGAAGGVLSGLRQQFLDILPSMEQVKSALSNFWELAKTIGMAIGAVLVAPFYLLGQGFEKGAENAGGFADVLGRVREVVGDAMRGIGNFISDILPSLNFEKIVAFINQVLVAGVLAGTARLQWGLGSTLGSFAGFADELRDVIGKNGILGQLESNLKSMQNNIRADSLLKIAGAIALLAGALFVLAQLDPAEIGIGLGAIVTLMASLTASLAAAGKWGANPVTAVAFASSMILIAAGVTAMSAAVAIFGNMDLGTLVQGIGTIAVILGLFAGMSALLGKGGAVGALGLIGISVAMVILSGALLTFIGAIKKYAAMDTSDLIEGTVKIAAVLVALGLAMGFVSGGIAGAIAIGIMALSLQLLIPALVKLADIGWGTILKGAGIFAVAMLIIGAAAYFVGPALLILGAAVALLGVGMLTFGLGVAAFGAGLAVLVGLGGTAAVVLTGYISAIAAMIPLIAEQVGLGIVAIANVIIEKMPVIQEATAVIIIGLIAAFIEALPAIEKALVLLIDAALRVLRQSYEAFQREGILLLINLLRGLEDGIPDMARQALRTFDAFADAFEKYIPRMAERGFDMIIETINGIADAVETRSFELVLAGINLGSAMIRGIASGIASGVGIIKDAAINAAKSAFNAAMDWLDINSPSKKFRDEIGKPISEGMAMGIDAMAGDVATSAVNAGKGALGAMKASMSDISKAISVDPNLSPTISPVLDLTAVARDASRIGNMLDMNPMVPTVSYARASILATEADEAREADIAASEAEPQTVIQFTQHNTSPVALSPTDIYMRTRNQLSLAKEALANS